MSSDSFDDVSSTSSKIEESIESSTRENVLGKLLWNLDTSSLLHLKQFFQKLDEDWVSEDGPKLHLQKHRERRTLYIGRKDFENAINSVFGNTDFQSHSQALFDALDVEKTGFIWWEHLLDQLIECGEKRTRRNLEGWCPVNKDKIRIIDAPHCKKECVVFVISIETEINFCYVVISKYGKVGVYDGKLKLLCDYDVFFIRTGISRRVRDVWITAAINLEDSKNLVLAASDRSLMIYDSSTLYHVPVFLITGVPSIPTAMTYNASKETKDSSCIMMGDDHGGITLITFKQPRVGLFFKHIQDKLNVIIWIDLHCILQEPYCDIRVIRRLHTRPVKKLVYVALNDSIISCSSDPNMSLVIRHRKGTRESYIFKVNKGICCFHYSVILNILLTGSSDGRVRIWDPIITQKPSAIFPTQNAAIMDVAVLAHVSAAITFNKNGELKVWDILHTACLQSLFIAFPSFGILGRLIQFGPSSLYSGPGRKQPTKDMMVKIFQKPQITLGDASGNENVLKLSSILDDDSDGDLHFESTIEKDKIMEEFTWERQEILVACCNHIALIHIQDSEEHKCSTLDSKNLLPPPEKTHKPRKPSIWKDKQYDFDVSASGRADQPDEHLKEDFGNLQGSVLDKISTNRFMSSPDLTSEDEMKCRPIADTDEMSLEELLKRAGLSGILEEDFAKKYGIVNDMNARLALQKSKMEKMRLQVAQGAPYSTLELQEPQEIRFSIPLPLSTRMQKRSGLEYFTEPQQILRHNSCFSMSTARSNYTNNSSTNPSKKSNASLDKISSK